jgi:hypothetical protein
MPSPYAAAVCCSFITGSWKQNLLQARRLGSTTTITDLEPVLFLFVSLLCVVLPLLFFDFVMFEYWEDDGRPEAQPARRSLFLYFFASHSTCLLWLLFRTPRYDIQGKDRNKEREKLFDRLLLRCQASFDSLWGLLLTCVGLDGNADTLFPRLDISIP